MREKLEAADSRRHVPNDDENKDKMKVKEKCDA
jgi:hypothetical protein